MDVKQVPEGYQPQDGYEVRRFVVTTGSNRQTVFILSPNHLKGKNIASQVYSTIVK